MTQPAKNKAAASEQGSQEAGEQPAAETQKGPEKPHPAAVSEAEGEAGSGQQNQQGQQGQKPGGPAGQQGPGARQTGPGQPGQPPAKQPGQPGQPGQKQGQQQPKPAAQPNPNAGAGKPGPAQRPPAGAARPRRRHWLLLLSFLACVVLPSIGAAFYLWGVAVDQYASRMGFTVRQEDSASAVELLGGLSNLSSSSSSDTDVLYEFIQSQKLVSDIDEELDLHAIWSRPEFDPVFALESDASIETLVDYWEDMVRISYGAGSGLIEVEVRAFRPEDATRIAEALLDRSAEMINSLSAVAREDSISYAREDLDEAVERLKEARETITRFRNENQIVNPELDLQSQAGLLGNLQSQEAEQIIELDLLRDTARENDPRLDQAERRLSVIRERIAAERQKLGFDGRQGGNQAFADLVGEYERLSVDREFAEQAYVSALSAYDAALADARRKSRYLATYMEPTSAQTAEYPKRAVLLGAVALFLFLTWTIVVLVLYSVKDRR